MNDHMGPTREIEKILLLFDEQYEDLYCFLRRYTPPRESEDLCQQVFLELCNMQESENTSLDLDSLIKIARSLLRRRYRPLQRIHSALIDRNTKVEVEEHIDGPLPTTTRWLRKVSKELSSLPTDLRQSIRLVIAEGNSLQEAAERMGVTSRLVESWTSTGLDMLTKRMCNHDQHA